MKIALFGNNHQASKSLHVQRIIDALRKHRFHIYIERDFATFVSDVLGLSLTDCEVVSEADLDADIAVSVGGDGTFLGTASVVAGKDIPILGINTGRLGFLADVSPENIEQAFDRLAAGDYLTEQHSLIATTPHPQCTDVPPLALNEVAVLKHDNSSTIEIAVSINDQPMTNYVADGLLIATPTGSTGYNLSAGGPIITPGTSALCLTPVAPHSLSVRPVVLPDNVKISLKVKSRSGRYLLASDGRSLSLPDSVELCLGRAAQSIQVVKIFHTSYFNTLRAKLGWNDASISESRTSQL